MKKIRYFALSWWEYIKKKWDKVILISLALLLYATVVERSNLLRDIDPLVNCLLSGTILGVILPRTKFSRTFSYYYSFLLSIPLVFQFTQQIVPSSIFSLSFWQFVDILNIRLFAALQDLAQIGAEFIVSRQAFTSTNLSIILGWASWQISFWLCWKSINESRSFIAILPIGLGTAVIMQISGQQIGVLLVFVVTGLILLSSTYAERIKAAWERDAIPYPWDFGLDWVASAIMFSLLIGFFSFVFYLGGSKEGWREVDKFIDRFRQPASQPISVEEDVSDDLSAQQTEIDASTSDLLIRFEPPPILTTSIMKVKLSDPPPIPPEVSGDVSRNYYLRSDIYSFYTGENWLPVALFPSTFPEVDPQEEPQGRYYLQQEYQILAKDWSYLFSINQPIWASEGVQVFSAKEDENSVLNSNSNEYVVESWVTQVTADELVKAGNNYPPSILSEYTQLPDTLPQRVSDLAQSLSANLNSSYEIAISVQNYLRTNYPYSLEVAPPPANRDVVDYFLFDEKQGFCSYYASSMTILLRTLGIPSRVVTGYVTSNYNYQEQQYVVTASSAHAWVEVYFPGYGWVEFEPTASQPAPDYGVISSPVGSSNIFNNEPGKITNKLNEKILVIIGFLLFSGMIIYWLYAKGEMGIKIKLVPADQQYTRLRIFLNRLGFIAPASITPLEYSQLFLPQLETWPWLQDLLDSSTKLYIGEIYSLIKPSPQQLLENGKLWNNSTFERGKLLFSCLITNLLNRSR